MNEQLKKNKGILRDFMRLQYSDERLVMLLDHARSGALSFRSCCCFIGIVTTDLKVLHSLMCGDYGCERWKTNLRSARALPGASQAEGAFKLLSWHDERRSLLLIPIILAELKRRNSIQATTERSADEPRTILGHV